MPPRNDETFAGPADVSPTGTRLSGLLRYDLKRGFGVAHAPSRSSLRPSMASALSMPPALPHPWLRLPATPALGARATPRWRRQVLRLGPPRKCEGEAGIGERLRSDEVLRETTKLLPAPPTCRPQVRGSLGFSNPRLKRGFGVAHAPSRSSLRPSMASALSMPPALRHPWLRVPATPALGARATPRWRRRAVCCGVLRCAGRRPHHSGSSRPCSWSFFRSVLRLMPRRAAALSWTPPQAASICEISSRSTRLTTRS